MNYLPQTNLYVFYVVKALFMVGVTLVGIVLNTNSISSVPSDV
jgi:hypothetical protein